LSKGFWVTLEARQIDDIQGPVEKRGSKKGKVYGCDPVKGDQRNHRGKFGEEKMTGGKRWCR